METSLNKKNGKGFTLIELLITVSIIAILSTAVILIINPVELLRESRDSSRLSDINILKKAILLYLADTGSSASIGSVDTCYASSLSAPSTSGCGGRMLASAVSTTTAASSTSISGGGWVPINFSVVSYGLPISTEPLDPVNDSTYFYSYASNSSLQFEIDVDMESNRYSAGGTGDVESKDGGSNQSIYEVGSNLGL